MRVTCYGVSHPLQQWVGHQVCGLQIVRSMPAVNAFSCTNAVTQVFEHSPHHRHVEQGGRGRLTASATDTDTRLLSIGQHIMARGDIVTCQ